MAAAMPDGPRRCIDVPGRDDLFYNTGSNSQASFDTVVSFDLGVGLVPRLVGAALSDAPGLDNAPRMLLNRETNKPNYLHKYEYFIKFCTVLTLQSPVNSLEFTHLKHVYWEVRYNLEFSPTSNDADFVWEVGGAGQNGATVSPIFNGPPGKNHLWLGALQDTTQPICTPTIQTLPFAQHFTTHRCW
jgi:hypothetical protein